MTKRISTGLLLGIIAGVLDMIPMIIQKLTWDANLSAFFLWIVVGFMTATSSLKLTGFIKGIIIALLCLLPSIFIIGWNNPMNLIPVLIMTIILGALLGFSYSKIIRDVNQ